MVVDTSGNDGSNNNNKYYSFGGILKGKTIDMWIGIGYIVVVICYMVYTIVWDSEMLDNNDKKF